MVLVLVLGGQVLVLVLVLGGQILVLVLVLGGQVLVLVLVLECQVPSDQYKTAEIIPVSGAWVNIPGAQWSSMARFLQYKVDIECGKDKRRQAERQKNRQ